MPSTTSLVSFTCLAYLHVRDLLLVKVVMVKPWVVVGRVGSYQSALQLAKLNSHSMAPTSNSAVTAALVHPVIEI